MYRADGNHCGSASGFIGKCPWARVISSRCLNRARYWALALLHGMMRPLTAVAIDEVHTFSLDAAAITQLSDAAQLILGECLLHTLRKADPANSIRTVAVYGERRLCRLKSLLQSVVGSASWRSGAAGIDISLAGLPRRCR